MKMGDSNLDECIYDALEKAARQNPQKPSIKLRVNTKLNLENTNKKACATMGPDKVTPPDPANFLKKNTKKMYNRDIAELPVQHCKKEKKRPPVPSVKELIKNNKANVQKVQTDFVSANIKNISKIKPTLITPKFVDTRNGDKQYVNNSGLEAKYILKKDFGKTPKYLLDRINKAATEAQDKSDGKDLRNVPGCTYISREERQELLDGMKKRWEKKQVEYQLLPIIIDTVTKVQRKSKLEKQLEALEKDIQFIERHKYIYVKK